jgi:UDP-N-acetylmuramoylalanine--D-glutamate ligase
VVVLGAARQGIVLARYLAQHGAQVILNDRQPETELQSARTALLDLENREGNPLRWAFGGHPLELLEGADLLCVSGGVPLTLPIVVEARRRGISLSNDSQIFMEAVPCPVIGITGSAGKTTTTTLVGRMAQAAYTAEKPASRVWVGGNIGVPLIGVLDEMSPQDLAVVELSSFQLELMTRSPQVAAVLNITPNHLDRHGNMEAYTAAKARILAYQSGEDFAVLGRDDLGAWSLAGQVKGGLVSFGLKETAQMVAGSGVQPADVFSQDGELFFRQGDRLTRLMSRSAIELRGDHNLLNVLAACAISLAAGLPAEALEAGVRGFGGVAHRLEFVRSWGGADWYNDSIATAPERTIAAIRSFTEPLVLLLGGRDKDLPWDELAALAKQRVDHLIVFGEAADKIMAALDRVIAISDRAVPTRTVTRCSGLRQAVQIASQVVRPGDVVLLSPGGTSFDEFTDFEERGECFRQLVMQL